MLSFFPFLRKWYVFCLALPGNGAFDFLVLYAQFNAHSLTFSSLSVSAPAFPLSEPFFSRSFSFFPPVLRSLRVRGLAVIRPPPTFQTVQKVNTLGHLTQKNNMSANRPPPFLFATFFSEPRKHPRSFRSPFTIRFLSGLSGGPIALFPPFLSRSIRSQYY